MKPIQLYSIMIGLLLLICLFLPSAGLSQNPAPDRGTNWDALIEKRRQVAREWEAYQKRLEAELKRLESREKDRRVSPADQVAGWTKFLETYKEDNPFSPIDEVIRQKAQSRIQYWQGNQTTRSVAKGQPFSNTLGMSFVKIKGGSFLMGSPPGELGQSGYESPQHQVTLTRGFYMQTTEVTQEQWQKIMGTNPAQYNGCLKCPVENITWDDAVEFIRRLNILEKTNKYRLPSEAEWEYACRAGSKTAFANGPITDSQCDDPKLKEMAWFCVQNPHPVAQKKPNAWGLYDMHGNVWEWCQDWYYDYTGAPQTNPLGPTEGRLKIFRGGSYYDAAWSCRSAQRYYDNPTTPSYLVGFRLVRDL